jgi:hypothetical protein
MDILCYISHKILIVFYLLVIPNKRRMEFMRSKITKQALNEFSYCEIVKQSYHENMAPSYNIHVNERETVLWQVPLFASVQIHPFFIFYPSCIPEKVGVN